MLRTENVVFLVVLVVAAGFFALNVQRLVRFNTVNPPGNERAAGAICSRPAETTWEGEVGALWATEPCPECTSAARREPRPPRLR